VALIVLVAAMATLVFLQVIFRYVLGQSLYWSEELSRYIFIWITMIGAALSLKSSSHFGLDLFFKKLPQQGKRWVGFLIRSLIGGIILIILIQGSFLVKKAVYQLSPAMQISMGLVYACLPLGGALMAVHFLANILKETVEKSETA